MSVLTGMLDGKMSLRWILFVMLFMFGSSLCSSLGVVCGGVKGVKVLYLTFFMFLLECTLIFSCVVFCAEGILWVTVVCVHLMGFCGFGPCVLFRFFRCNFVEVFCMLIFGSMFGMLCLVSLGSVLDVYVSMTECVRCVILYLL